MNRLDSNWSPFENSDLEKHISAVLHSKPSESSLLEYLYRVVHRVFDPVLIDADKIPPQPCMFVANHAAMGLDAAVLIPTLQHHKGRTLRALGDNWMWSPRSESLLYELGIALANPKVCDALMEEGEDILVYPGGAREAVKPSSKKYQLMWGERRGFVRMALKHGYTIQPLATVGPEEFYDHWLEGEDLYRSPLRILLQKLGVVSRKLRSDLVPPIPMGLFGTLLPKPQRCYIQCGEPVDLSRYRNRATDEALVAKLSKQVAEQIEHLLKDLRKYRDANRYKDDLWRFWMSV